MIKREWVKDLKPFVLLGFYCRGCHHPSCSSLDTPMGKSLRRLSWGLARLRASVFAYFTGSCFNMTHNAMCCHITLYKTGGASGGCTRKPPVCGLQAHNTWMDSGGFFIISVNLKLEYKIRKDQGDHAVHSTQYSNVFPVTSKCSFAVWWSIATPASVSPK